MSELIMTLVDRVQTAAELVSAADIELATGLDALDVAIGGLRAGDLTLLTGAPGCGKSSFVTSLVRHTVLDEGCPAVLASLQAKGEHVLTKIISNAAAIPLRTDVDVLASIERYGRCAVVAIDHSQLLQPSPEQGTAFASALRETCCELKLMARRRDCAVLLIESSNLRGSLVEMIPEADVILELRRTGNFDGVGRDERCELRVLKQQMGPPCTVLLRFAAATGTFRSHGG